LTGWKNCSVDKLGCTRKHTATDRIDSRALEVTRALEMTNGFDV
jgi:hypothetical protein